MFDESGIVLGAWGDVKGIFAGSGVHGNASGLVSVVGVKSGKVRFPFVLAELGFSFDDLGRREAVLLAKSGVYFIVD